MYKVVDLFAGAGGLSLGFMQTQKYDVKVAFENNKNMQETYRKNHPGVDVQGDVCVADYNEIRKKYNYEGIIMTDELGMRSVSILYGKYRSVKKAFLAGNDIVCLKYSKDYVEKIIKKIERKAIVNQTFEKQINESFERIINIKKKYNLSDDAIVNNIDIEKYNKIIEKINK